MAAVAVGVPLFKLLTYLEDRGSVNRRKEESREMDLRRERAEIAAEKRRARQEELQEMEQRAAKRAAAQSKPAAAQVPQKKK